MAYGTFAKYSSEFLRSIYTPYYATIRRCNNFYGISGEPEARLLNEGDIIHQHKRVRKEYHFDQLHMRDNLF